MQDSTRVMAGNSEFFLSLVGTQVYLVTCEISWGDSSLAGMFRVAPLVAVMDGCSLVLARDYSIVLLGVNSVVAGVSILSSGGMQAPLSLW